MSDTSPFDIPLQGSVVTGSGADVLPSGGAGVSGAVGAVLASATGWLSAPFVTPLDTVDVVLLVGIVLVAIVLWNLILFHIRIAAEEIG